MTRLPILTFPLLALLTAPAFALDLAMPAPVLSVEVRTEPSASYALPTGPFRDGVLPARRVEGALDQRAFRLDSGRKSLTDLASPLRAQLEAQGFRVVLDCDARECGGFDFRFATDVMPEPGMHVDLGEFRFIAAEKADEAVSLMVSRSGSAGFVQLTRVGATALPEIDPSVVAAPAPAPTTEPGLVPAAEPAALPVATPESPAPTLTPLAPGDVVALLQADGHVALDDLVFASGAAVLEEGDYASLSALADWLKADAARTIVLVGHTDGSGALKANVALSKQRAEGVRQVLLMRYDVAAAQVTAEGIGPLAPRISNATPEGRRKNRRVEAIQTSTQ